MQCFISVTITVAQMIKLYCTEKASSVTQDVRNRWSLESFDVLRWYLECTAKHWHARQTNRMFDQKSDTRMEPKTINLYQQVAARMARLIDEVPSDLAKRSPQCEDSAGNWESA